MSTHISRHTHAYTHMIIMHTHAISIVMPFIPRYLLFANELLEHPTAKMIMETHVPFCTLTLPPTHTHAHTNTHKNIRHTQHPYPSRTACCAFRSAWAASTRAFIHFHTLALPHKTCPRAHHTQHAYPFRRPLAALPVVPFALPGPRAHERFLLFRERHSPWPVERSLRPSSASASPRAPHTGPQTRKVCEK